MVFVGIDASTKKTGMCCIIDGQLSKYELIDCEKYTDKELRMREMSLKILELLNKWKPKMVCIEDSWNSFNVETTKMLTRIMGVTYGWAIQNDAHWEQILPSKWRKLCGIEQSKKKRQELKQASIDYVKAKYGIDVNDDVADSIALSDGVFNYYDKLSNKE